jgi:FAD/FMN-containing dehydrogenase
VAPQSTGHNAPPLAAQDLSDVVVVRTGAIDEVLIDPAKRRARVGGGTLWLPAVEAAATHGLAALHGSSPDVSIAGYSLGGGLGWYARLLGLAANSLTAVELVTADGELVRADAQHEAELFWALREAAATSVW